MNSAYRNFATLIFTVAVLVATGLVTIILRNPASHSNPESAEFYNRTQLALLGEDYDYAGYGLGELIDAGADPLLVGRTLYVRAGCIGCHGQFGQGGVIGSQLWDLVAADPGDVIREVREGPSGMPPYPESILAGDEMDLIVSFLKTAHDDAVTAGVTTTTTLPATTTVVPPVTTATTPGGQTTTTAVVASLVIDAPMASITVDGDPSDWEGVAGLELTLEPIVDENAPSKQSEIWVAHDDSFVYVLFAVVDDFDWSDLDPHFSGSPGIMWAIEQAAGPNMGGTDETGIPGLGMVDIWTWRLDCPIGVEQGGAVHDPGSGKPGNDGTCNLDDEFATEPETVEDDGGEGAENSLLGVFSHTNPQNGSEGTWYFEFRRPLQTGDPYDAQFGEGGAARLALAYWDPDVGQSGWGRRDHVQSSYLGWIEVTFTE